MEVWTLSSRLLRECLRLPKTETAWNWEQRTLKTSWVVGLPLKGTSLERGRRRKERRKEEESEAWVRQKRRRERWEIRSFKYYLAWRLRFVKVREFF